VVLVEPQQPGNVGAVARAMMNTGLTRLVIVDPPAYDPHRARMMAPGCDDLIASARIVATLDDALVGVHRVIASTARHRKLAQRVMAPRELALEVVADTRQTAILFGREDFGLSAEHVARCEAIVRIPTPDHASLNLAQAVLLVGHAIFEANHADRGPSGRIVGGRQQRETTALEPNDVLADLPALEGAVQQATDLLGRIGYPVARDKLGVAVRSALQRASLSVREIGALRGVLKHVERAIPPREP
jgi:tRNA (cytidine32/uridine32-2'-O)-methyltransferase